MEKSKILIIDDSKPILCLLEAILGKYFKVFTANDGLSAMKWLSEGNKPHLIISDLQMPNINGWEIIEHISSSSYLGDIPVLVLSGSDEERIEEKCAELGAAGYLPKPFDPNQLLEKIHSLLFTKNNKPYKNFFFI